MSMYAVKSPKGKEFFYSKKIVIDLGNRTKKVLDYAIDALNALSTPHFLSCEPNEVWRLCDDEYMCKGYANYKAVIGKRGFRVTRIA